MEEPSYYLNLSPLQVLNFFIYLSNPWLKQIYIIFLAKLKKPHFSPGPESSECRLFALDEIPFDSLAFSSISVTLQLVRFYFEHMTLICLSN